MSGWEEKSSTRPTRHCSKSSQTSPSGRSRNPGLPVPRVCVPLVEVLLVEVHPSVTSRLVEVQLVEVRLVGRASRPCMGRASRTGIEMRRSPGPFSDSSVSVPI